jgi:hypothetical protein
MPTTLREPTPSHTQTHSLPVAQSPFKISPHFAASEAFTAPPPSALPLPAKYRAKSQSPPTAYPSTHQPTPVIKAINGTAPSRQQSLDEMGTMLKMALKIPIRSGVT